MNYGLYLSASGVLTNLYRQDVFANNLANVQTVGFKADVPAIRQRDPESVEDYLRFDVSQRLLDRLGGGVFAGPQRVNFEPGQLRETSNPLDVALNDRNSFFAVQFTDPNTNAAGIRLTRDGRFTRNATGELVTQAHYRVLDAADRPITVDGDGEIRIDSAGRIHQNGVPIARLQVAIVQDTSVLVKQGQNLFSFEGKDPRQISDNPSVRSGYVESSGVDPIQALMRLTAATKAATGNAQLIRYFDLLMDRSVNTLGVVA